MSRLDATAVDLGVLRAWICGAFLISIIGKDFGDLAQVPATVLRPTGVLWVFSWGFWDALLTPTGMVLLKSLLVGSLSLAMIGYMTPWTTKLAATGMMFHQGLVRSLRGLDHDEMLGVYLLVVLAFTACGDGFAVDSLGRSRRRSSGFRYGYPILLMQVLLVWAYFTAGVSKLQYSGLGYFAADNLAVAAITFSLGNLNGTDYGLAFHLPRFPDLLPPALIAMVVWELTFPLALFWKRVRWWYLGSGAVFHVLTGILMNVFFKFTLAMYAIFVDWRAVGRWLLRFAPLRSWRARWRAFAAVPEEFPTVRAGPELRSVLVWDGQCAVCGRFVAMLEARARTPFAARPFETLANDVPEVVREWSTRQMHWIDADGRVLGGSLATIAVIAAAGHTLLAAVLESRAVRPLIWLGYRLFSTHRARLAA